MHVNVIHDRVNRIIESKRTVGISSNDSVFSKNVEKKKERKKWRSITKTTKEFGNKRKDDKWQKRENI